MTAGSALLRFCCIGACILAGAPTLAAQRAALDGHYEYVADGSDDINAAINEAVAPLNFAFRAIGRARLRRTNAPYRTVRIEQRGAEIVVAMDGGNPIVTPANGTPARWRREDGEVFQVSTRWEGERLRQTFVADDGRRENLFAHAAHGHTLTMDVTVSSPRLPQPVRYRLVYRRAPADHRSH